MMGESQRPEGSTQFATHGENVLDIWFIRLTLRLVDASAPTSWQEVTVMRIEKQLTPEAVLGELGRRLARRRLDLGITQADAAEQAGLGKRTVERIEAGGDTQMSSIIRLLRVLGLLEGLESLIPDTGPRPMDLLKLRGKERRRASSRRAAKPNDEWRWGDEQ